MNDGDGDGDGDDQTSADWAAVRFYAVMAVFGGVGIFCIVNALRVLFA